MQDIVTILSSGALSSVLVFLFRNWISERIKASIQHEYDQKLETHKAQLRSQTETEIVRLKTQLEIAAAERTFRFSHVFERTAEAIATTYQKLLELEQAVQNYTQLLEPSDDPNRTELAKILRTKANEFSEYFRPNRIYIPKSTAEKIRIFSDAVHGLAFHFSMAMAVEKAQVRNPDLVEERHRTLEELRNKVPELLTSLEDDFQKVLGFPIEGKPVA
jgi:hypothetical protein